MKTRVVLGLLLLAGTAAGVVVACGGQASTIPGIGNEAGSDEAGSTPEGGASDEGGVVTEGGASDGGLDANAEVDGSDASVCSTLKPQGVNVQVMFGGATVPTAKGGPITAGTYNLTKVTVYGANAPDAGLTGVLERGLLQISATNYESATLVDVTGQPTTRREVKGTYALAASGKDLDVSELCPKVQTSSIGYTSEPTGITLYVDETVAGKVLTAEVKYTP